jgi:hypothetical protein
MQIRRIAGLAAALAVLAAPTAAQAGTTVSVRVEGEHATLLERTPVALGTAPPVAGCPGTDTAAAALDAGTHGNWDRQPFTQTILGETHDFSRSDYWAEWIGSALGYRFGNGICNDHLAAGEELVMLVDFSPGGVPTVFPLAVEGLPSRVAAGSTVTVTVVEYRASTSGPGVRTPVAGASIGGVTTGPGGRATLRFSRPGDEVLKATKAGDAPSAAAHVLVSAAGTPPPAAPAPDRTPPAARVLGIRDRHVFRARRAPRTIRVAVPVDPSGVRTVLLRLRRHLGHRCWYFSGRRARFVRSRCGRKVEFAVPAQPRVSYLLPRRLGRGFYVLGAVAVDGAGNREPLARGRNRVVFYVR